MNTNDDKPCTDEAPCFNCTQCAIKMLNVFATDPAVRAHMTGVETRPSWKAAGTQADIDARVAASMCAPLFAAAADGARLRGDSSDGTIYAAWIDPGRSASLTKPHVATLPNGSRVELPAGTVLREGTLPPEIEPAEPRTLGKQLHDEHNRTTHADGSRCLCDPATTVLADLTERVGLPREMAPPPTYDLRGGETESMARVRARAAARLGIAPADVTDEQIWTEAERPRHGMPCGLPDPAGAPCLILATCPHEIHDGQPRT